MDLFPKLSSNSIILGCIRPTVAPIFNQVFTNRPSGQTFYFKNYINFNNSQQDYGKQ